MDIDIELQKLIELKSTYRTRGVKKTVFKPKTKKPKHQKLPPPIRIPDYYEEVGAGILIGKSSSMVGFWTGEEHRKYLEIVEKYKNQLMEGKFIREMFKELEYALPERTRKQIQNHHYYENPYPKNLTKEKKKKKRKTRNGNDVLEIYEIEDKPQLFVKQDSLFLQFQKEKEKETQVQLTNEEEEEDEWEKWKQWKEKENKDYQVELLYMQAQVPIDFNLYDYLEKTGFDSMQPISTFPNEFISPEGIFISNGLPNYYY